MSALNADPAAPSYYLKTKGEAENLVHAAKGIAVSSFRPSVIFGPDDSFVNRFAGLLRIAPVFPLACPNARFAPVYVGDVAQAMMDALQNRDDFGRRIELCGPRDYRLIEIVRYIAQVLHLKRGILPLPGWAARIQAELLEYVPGKPFSRDNYRSLSLPSVCRDGKRCMTPMEAVVPGYL
jgi:NADH dehydrogenase